MLVFLYLVFFVARRVLIYLCIRNMPMSLNVHTVAHGDRASADRWCYGLADNHQIVVFAKLVLRQRARLRVACACTST
jgi:hypothetical protein